MWRYIVSFILIIIGMAIIKSIDYKKRFNFYQNRLEKTNDNIKTNLLKKYELLTKQINLFKNKKKIKEEDYESFFDIDRKTINIFELDNEINNVEEKLNKVLQNNIKLIRVHEFKKNINDIEKITITINGTKKYYNTLCLKYNRDLKRFPIKYYGKIKKYKEKELYEFKEEKLKVLDN